jgi:hypothetical protein
MTQQVQYFEALRSKMVAHPNADQVALRISKSLFLISSGGNDAFAFFAANKSLNNTDLSLFYNSTVSKFEIHIKVFFFF